MILLSKERLIKLLVDNADMTEEQANRVWARNFQKRQSCIIVTMDGDFPAVATPDEHYPKLIDIVSDNGKYRIQVIKSLAEHKFKDSNVPEFYAC